MSMSSCTSANRMRTNVRPGCSRASRGQADGSPAGETLRAQLAQALRNLDAVAIAVGVGPHDFARTTIYVKDWRPELMDELYEAVNDYIEGGGRFGGFTASTLVGVAALYEPWCLVEIDAVAVVD